MISIVLADDHQVVREGFRQLLEAQPDMKIVGEAGDGLTAIALVKQLQPDVLVLDMVLPDLHGLEVLVRVSEDSPRTRVIILSMYDDQGYVLKALRDGALAYVLKQSSSQELVRAIREAMLGRHWLSLSLVEPVIAAYLRSNSRDLVEPYESLSFREREVLQLFGEGCNSQQIATALSLSKRTVETYRARLMIKLGLHSQVELVQYVLARHRRSL